MQGQDRMAQGLDRRYGRKSRYPVREAAEFWGVSEKTVRRWIKKGEVEATNPGERQTGIPREQMINRAWERRSK
jgi:excisionase family DNA binding protein